MRFVRLDSTVQIKQTRLLLVTQEITVQEALRLVRHVQPDRIAPRRHQTMLYYVQMENTQALAGLSARPASPAVNAVGESIQLVQQLRLNTHWVDKQPVL